MKNNVQYLKIQSQADLRAERQRVASELNRVERRLQDDYQNVTRMFSFGYVAERVVGGAHRMSHLVEQVMLGYEFIRSLIDKYKTKVTDRKTETL